MSMCEVNMTRLKPHILEWFNIHSLLHEEEQTAYKWLWDGFTYAEIKNVS
jgi:hypothetical protein